MSKILYVDHIDTKDGSPVGRVISIDKIKRILELVEADMDEITALLTKTNNVNHVCRAGRFLLSTRIMLDAPDYKYQMVIADPNGDEISAGGFIASVLPDLRPLAAKLFNDLHYLSEEERNKFEIALGSEQQS